MAYYSYKMTFDYGFAPNPFGNVCTLATCKPNIRKKASVGDWVLGTGAKEIGLLNRVIYLMQVTEKLSLEEYWADKRYQFKKPTLNGSLMTIHGDNAYHQDENGCWLQDRCQHNHPDSRIREQHMKRDTRGRNVLLSERFYYFGNAHFEISPEFSLICSTLRDYSSIKTPDQIACFEAFIAWVALNYTVGVHGKPIHWKNYNQRQLIF